MDITTTGKTLYPGLVTYLQKFETETPSVVLRLLLGTLVAFNEIRLMSFLPVGGRNSCLSSGELRPSNDAREVEILKAHHSERGVLYWALCHLRPLSTS